MFAQMHHLYNSFFFRRFCHSLQWKSKPISAAGSKFVFADVVDLV